MPTSRHYEQERQELEAILASGIFSRAPNVAQLLTYVCGKYFEGETEQIKEYTIAVEALGRSADFNQKKDSIVRVEVHRLRKRLREYYDAEGANHPVHIVIPPGQYAPKFVFQESLVPVSSAPPAPAAPAIPTPALPAPNEVATPPIEFEMARPRQPKRSWMIAIAALVATAAVALLLWSNPRTRAKTTTPAVSVVPLPPTGEEIRILAGTENGDYVDGFGHTWVGDRFFQGGSVFHTANHPIAGTRDPSLYQSRREGPFGYDIPLKPGSYELHLYFAETLYGDANTAGGGESSRIFDVAANGKTLLRDFDVTADAGPSAADVKVFKDISPAPDGKLHLTFAARTGVPFLNAIELVPGVPGKMIPIRVIARDRGYTGKDGVSWAPDRYAKGGQLVLRADPVQGVPDPELYRGERFGNLTYSFPVAPGGRYAVNLRFAETWFGPGMPGGGGAGNRVFDVLCNGVALMRNVDIFKEAGGSNRALVRTFHGLQPNHQGKLVISMIPVTNYACVNAIEVIDESK